MKIFGYNVEECLTFFMLVVVGYFIAKLFSQKCNGFSVGAQIKCDKIKNPTNCRRHRIHGCELKDDKCTYKNAPAPAGKKDNDSECNSDFVCKSGYCNGSNKCEGCPNDPNYKLNPQDCSKCKNNDKLEPPNCTKCINSNLDLATNCTKCINSNLDLATNCTKCINSDLDLASNCTKCNNTKLESPECSKCANKAFTDPPHCLTCKSILHGGVNCDKCIESHKIYPDCTTIKDCTDLDLTNCHQNVLCESVNNQCQSIIKKRLGDLCKENSECQTGVCHSKDLIDPDKCMNCSDVNVAACTLDPVLDGHGDVCDLDKEKNPVECRFRPCRVRSNQVDKCEEKNNAGECHNARNKNNELCWFNNSTNICSNKKKNGEIAKCKP